MEWGWEGVGWVSVVEKRRTKAERLVTTITATRCCPSETQSRGKSGWNEDEEEERAAGD